MSDSYFNNSEKILAFKQCKELVMLSKGIMSHDDIRLLYEIIKQGIENGHLHRDKYGINPVIRTLNTAILLAENIHADRNMIIAVLIYSLCHNESITPEEMQNKFGDDTLKLVSGLIKISSLYKKQAAVESENFHKLLLTFAQDIRVILIMIVDRLGIMRMINHHPNEKFVHDISSEAKYLYAPLAHRLGLYKIKSELEDLSLKYTERETYTQIARKLNETKAARDKYISDFIEPLKVALDNTHLKYDIKGRTKSINSIWNKMKKQHADVDDIFDLFAIRIIIDTPLKSEKADCWLAYSIVTDMYTANTARLKDWISNPKSNGYESLHITVYGPQSKWVEVQIRTKRMDEVAERGLAAHWKYKGIKSEGSIDDWMNNIRDILESGNTPTELMRDVHMDIYNEEVFAFTPKGDLFRLPAGATLLDFAFAIHSNVGCTCTGGKVNGKNKKITYKIKSGDTIEILTSSAQAPNPNWLNIVITNKARNKIRQSLNEQTSKNVGLGKELLQRRFKNRKIDIDESILTKAIKKLGYKTATDFYIDLLDKLDVNDVVNTYLSIAEPTDQSFIPESAENFTFQQHTTNEIPETRDILIIGDNIKGINYKLSRCCNPIIGDKITGFTSSDGAIKIHRSDCKNMQHLMQRYPYRCINAAWSGKMGQQFAVTLRIIGNDDIGIVTNITSLINKENDTSLRSISIDSNDGIFRGYLVIGVNDTKSLNELIKKIKTVKGVKDVQRSN